MGEVIRRFEKANPDIRVEWTNISGYENLNTAIPGRLRQPGMWRRSNTTRCRNTRVSGQLLD